MKQVKFGKKINFWKWSFLAFLALQIAFLGVVWLRLTSPREQVKLPEMSHAVLTQVGTVSVNRSQLNETLSVYLQDYQLANFSYKVYVTEKEILFEGSYEILGTKIPLYVYLSPFKNETGAIVLEVQAVSAGTLSLPKTDILKYIKKHYKLPYFIHIDEKQEQILVDLPNLDNKLDLVFKARTLDLYNDQLIFEIYRKND